MKRLNGEEWTPLFLPSSKMVRGNLFGSIHSTNRCSGPTNAWRYMGQNSYKEAGPPDAQIWSGLSAEYPVDELSGKCLDGDTR